jgi:cell wall-associated NlpC family hydrolase
MPYVWGGDGAHEGGFDCSGLTHAAYAAADIRLPRTAQTQYDAGPAVPLGQPLQPGDLVYYGTPTNIHHVGLYLGNDQMINAPQRGQLVQITPYRWPGDDYHGATRPAKQD